MQHPHELNIKRSSRASIEVKPSLNNLSIASFEILCCVAQFMTISSSETVLISITFSESSSFNDILAINVKVTSHESFPVRSSNFCWIYHNLFLNHMRDIPAKKAVFLVTIGTTIQKSRDSCFTFRVFFQHISKESGSFSYTRSVPCWEIKHSLNNLDFHVRRHIGENEKTFINLCQFLELK